MTFELHAKPRRQENTQPNMSPQLDKRQRKKKTLLRLGMDALVTAYSRNTNVIMVGAWMLW